MHATGRLGYLILRVCHAFSQFASDHLEQVKYEIRGPLARRAYAAEHAGYDIVKLNIGNPGAFGFKCPTPCAAHDRNSIPVTPIVIRHFPRVKPVMQQQDRGIMDVNSDHVFIGNGVSELIMMSMRRC